MWACCRAARRTQPLRVLVPTIGQEALAQLQPALENMVGWRFAFSFAPSDVIGTTVLDTQDTGRQFWDGW